MAARILGLREVSAQARRAYVRMQIVRVGRLGRLLAHLTYLQRDGVARDGGHGQLYSALDENAQGRPFAERCLGDRHQFRFAVTADDGAEYEDLRPLIRRFMGRMEEDLGTSLDWVAANHLDTFHPHSHIVLRGKDDRGENLIISPNYIVRGMRERVAEIVNLDLGPRTDFETDRRLLLGVRAERLTAIDLRFLGDMDAARIVSGSGSDMFDHAIRTGRLRKLETLGLAEALGHGRWHLDEELEATLHSLGERGDIFSSMQRSLIAAGLDRAASRQMIFRLGEGRKLSGRVIAGGLVDEISDRRFLIIDGLDGRSHYVDLGVGEAPGAITPGVIVRVSQRQEIPKEVSREPGARSVSPVKVELLAVNPLEQLCRLQGATWLDRKLAGEDPEPVRDAGFGHDVRSALALRRTWLVEHGLAREEGGVLLFGRDQLAKLQRREIVAEATRIAARVGKDFVELRAGGRIKGKVARSLNLVSGRFALIENDRDFALVPWEPALERALGREVSGQVGRRPNISWSFARERGIER